MDSRSASLALTFSSVGHFFAHLLMLLYPTVILVLEGRWGMSYGDLLSLSLGGFVLFGLGALPAGWLGDRWSAEWMMVVFFLGTGGAAITTGLGDGPLALALGLAAIGLFGSISRPVGTLSQAITVALPKAFAAGLTGLTDGGTLDAGGFVTLVFLVSATAQLAGGWLVDRFAMKAVYILAWAIQAPLFVLAIAAHDVPL